MTSSVPPSHPAHREVACSKMRPPLTVAVPPSARRVAAETRSCVQVRVCGAVLAAGGVPVEAGAEAAELGPVAGEEMVPPGAPEGAGADGPVRLTVQPDSTTTARTGVTRRRNMIGGLSTSLKSTLTHRDVAEVTRPSQRCRSPATPAADDGGRPENQKIAHSTRAAGAFPLVGENPRSVECAILDFWRPGRAGRVVSSWRGCGPWRAHGPPGPSCASAPPPASPRGTRRRGRTPAPAPASARGPGRAARALHRWRSARW